jgi:hypothetical protein
VKKLDEFPSLLAELKSLLGTFSLIALMVNLVLASVDGQIVMPSICGLSSY